MKKKSLFTKIIAFVMTVVMLCPCLFSVTASAVVGGEDASDDFHQITLEEMKQMSQEEIAEYCRALAEYTISKDNESTPSIQPYWSSEAWGNYDEETTAATHFYITIYSFLLYMSTSNNMANTNAFLLTADDINTITIFSERPDRTGAASGYITHFYNPDTGESYLRGSTRLNARTSFLEQYEKAEKYFKNGKREQAMEHLGNALHFIQDVCEPHHSNNITATGIPKHDPHGDFETWVGNNFGNIETKGSITEQEYTYAKNSTPEKIFDAAANSNSHKQLSNANGNESARRTAAEISLGNALLYTTLVLYHFMVKNGLC